MRYDSQAIELPIKMTLIDKYLLYSGKSEYQEINAIMLGNSSGEDINRVVRHDRKSLRMEFYFI